MTAGRPHRSHVSPAGSVDSALIAQKTYDEAGIGASQALRCGIQGPSLAGLNAALRLRLPLLRGWSEGWDIEQRRVESLV